MTRHDNQIAGSVGLYRRRGKESIMQERINTLSISVVPQPDGTKDLVKKASIGMIGVDARIAYFLRKSSDPRDKWTEIPAEEALDLLNPTRGDRT